MPVILAFIFLIIAAAPAAGAALPQDLLDNGAVVVRFPDRPPLAINAEQPFIPASTIKIACALFALRTLGEDYRFQTHFLLTDDRTLYIKGYGDPLLIAEEVAVIATELEGIGPIRRIALDRTAFALDHRYHGDSTNPYDAENSALAVNFNTMNLIRENGVVRSAEPQTPTLPVMRIFAGTLPEGKTTRINVSSRPPVSLRYAGELFRSVLGDQAAGAVICERKAPARARPLVVHRQSRSLATIIRAMLRYSNNFIANQLFLVSGAHVFGYPATWEKSRRLFNEFMAGLGIPATAFHIEEGSGLSRDNTISASALAHLLDKFRPYHDLLPVRTGDYLKRGTLPGVYCYAGYLHGPLRPVPFVIMENQPRTTLDRLPPLLRP